MNFFPKLKFTRRQRQANRLADLVSHAQYFVWLCQDLEGMKPKHARQAAEVLVEEVRDALHFLEKHGDLAR